MKKIIIDFYSGYEGEPEIQFFKVSAMGDYKIIRIWGGYFDDLMTQFAPFQGEWTGLAYYYNLAIGWYETSPWQIVNLEEIKNDFCNLQMANCRFDKTRDVHKEICNMLGESIEYNERVFIAEE